MKKVNITRMRWRHWKSPKGTFEQYGKGVSEALGDVHRGWPKRGHPFNLELVRVPPGRKTCPFHYHTTQWEMYVILSGTGTARCGKSRHAVGPGDAFIHPPLEAHQLINDGSEDLVFYLIADNPPVDIFHYPDSNKWGMRPQGKFFRMTEAPYLDGEE